VSRRQSVGVSGIRVGDCLGGSGATGEDDCGEWPSPAAATASAAAGTATKVALATLVGAWGLRGLNPFEQCRRLLICPSP
jgi:hypothetical protein